MKKRLAIIGAIEGTDDGLLEKDYLFLINTIKRNNKKNNFDIHLVQPTNNDISNVTIKQLKKLGVIYTKEISSYNQSNKEFNYTNMPIACNYFFNKISNDYEYFLWLDGDVINYKKINLPEIKDDEIMIIYNNEYFNLENNNYIKFNSDNYEYDHKCYIDLKNKINLNKNNYEATNSWIIYGKSKNNIWKDWNNLTKIYIDNIKKIGKENFMFFNKSKNFENRVEELTLDIAFKNNNLKRIIPFNFHTFNSKDSDCIEYVEKFNEKNIFVHYDSTRYIKNNKNLLKYFDKPYLKTLFIKVYGLDYYNEIFK